MEKVMRKLPSIFVGVALIMQVARVSDFGKSINAGAFLAGVFAVFLAGVIFLLSYWDGRGEYIITADENDKRRYEAQKREKIKREEVRRDAVRWLAVFVLIDGGLNLAETMSRLPEQVTDWQRAGAMAYGLLPTLAAWGLGRLQGKIDKMQVVSKDGDLWEKIIARVLAWFDEQPAPQKAQEQEPQGEQVGPLNTTNLLAQWEKRPAISDADLARLFGVSRQAIYWRRKDLAEKGVIEYSDKQGVKVLAYPVGE